jgi:hypothetical protein
MRFSLAYNEDGSVLTTPLADEEARSLRRARGTSDLLDTTTHQVCDAELNEAMKGQDEMAARQFIQGNTRQEAHDGQL